MLKLVMSYADADWPELPPEEKITRTHTFDMLVIRKAAGKAAVVIRCDLEDGRTVLLETSASLFCRAAKIIETKYPETVG